MGVRHLSSPAQREAFAKQAYELHRDGMTYPDIATNLELDLDQVIALALWWAKNRLYVPDKETGVAMAVQRADNDLQELTKWQNRVEELYLAGDLDAVAAITRVTQLVKTKTEIGMRYAKLLGLDAPTTTNTNVTVNSAVDAELIAMYEQYSASLEEDAPLPE